MLAGRISAKMKMENLINVDGALKIVSPRELEVIEKSLSFENKGYAIEYLMAENSAGQKAIYSIPTDGGQHYREVREVNNYFRKVELTPPTTAQIWKGHGYTGGHTSQSHWNTSQQVEEMYRLISSGFVVLDETTEGSTSGYYPKVSYWKDNEKEIKSTDRFRDDSKNLTLQRILNSQKKQK
jgi:hypothetical protein